MTEPFAAMLTGGHPNSLGRTVEVVEQVMRYPERFEELFQCYFSADEVVRLRTSSAIKRIWREQPQKVVPYVDRFLSEVSTIDQPSTQWTFAQLFAELDAHITSNQRTRAITILQHNLTQTSDWIVLINTLDTLAAWARTDEGLRTWLLPQLNRFANDPRKSVAGRAKRHQKALLTG